MTDAARDPQDGKSPPGKDRGIVRRHSAMLFSEIWQRKPDFLLGMGTAILSAVVTLLLPQRAQTLIEETLPAGEFWPVAQGLAIMLLIAAVGIGFSSIRKYVLERLTNRITTDIRARVFRHLLSVSARRLQGAESGQLLSTFSNDIQVFSEAFKNVVSGVLPSALFSAIYAAAALWYSVELFVVLVFLFLPMMLIMDRLFRLTHVAAAEAQKRLATLVGELDQSLAGTKEIKLFGMQDSVLTKFDQENTSTLRALLRRDLLSTLFPFTISMIVSIGIAALILISMFLLQRGWLNVGELTAFVVCVGLLYGPLQDLSNSFGQSLQLFAVLARIEDLLELEPEADMADATVTAPKRGGLEFQKVSFSYGGEDRQIRELTLSVSEGEKIALVGPSGAGKSTLLELIPRFLEIDSGRILMGGIDISTLPLATLRAQIGLVQQVPFLFRGTLRENLTVGAPGVSEARLAEVAEMARIDSFLDTLPAGYETLLEQGGSNLSVGQRQRIAIARVLLKDPPILLLDEPTSALDSRAERDVSQAIARAAEGRTTIIVAHRLSTIRDVDRIVVMRSGHVVEEGSHAELLRRQGEFSQLWAAGGIAERQAG